MVSRNSKKEIRDPKKLVIYEQLKSINFGIVKGLMDVICIRLTADVGN